MPSEIQNSKALAEFKGDVSASPLFILTLKFIAKASKYLFLMSEYLM
jgi:hypothetical protein